MATPNVNTQNQLVTLVHLLTKYLLLNCIMVPNAPATSPDGHSECRYEKSTSDTCTSFNKTLVIGSKMVLNALTTSPDGYSQCRHTKSTRDTCASFNKILVIELYNGA